MGLKEKLEKIRKGNLLKGIELSESEKTGVLNGLLLLGAAVGALAGMSHKADATLAPTDCKDTLDQKVEQTNILGADQALDVSSWQDHSWHDHCWWDHNWWDHSWDDYSDTGGGGT